MRSDIGALVGIRCVPVASRSMSESDIRGLWEAVVWTFDTIPRQRIVLEGDA